MTRSLTNLPALITLFLVNGLPNKLAANIPNNIGRNPPFCSLASLLIVSLIHSVSNPDSSGDLTIFILFFMSSFEITNAAVSHEFYFE